ncbi:hypothetical protein ACI5KX_10975 [Erythrobacter sp. GH1-10]|uniref:hypothetical protein n=1 Tax=Erythrobacter sp. GH1-10 TaxID=3349334 RepID=UPI00387804AC
MKKMMTALAAMTLVVGVSACGARTDGDSAATASAGTIAGTWMIDLDSAEWENSDSNYVIADGEYTCNSCIPPYSIPADGEWQSVDRPGVDEIKVSVVDDMTIETATRFEGEDLGNSTWTVSEDGDSMTIAWNNLDGDTPVSGETNLVRAAEGPDGAHAASGQWSPAEVSSMSEEGRTVTISLDGDTISLRGNGGGYTATLGGDAVTIDGDNSGTLVAVEKTGDNTYRETFTRDGETTGVNDWTVDGDTVTVVATDPRDDSKVTWSATRQ